ncbi:hypothetical protein G6F66_014683 [Rhizopus arrhizus]|nr:hypothetical protein G6F66_014683 [Rhizopus arrhizus]
MRQLQDLRRVPVQEAARIGKGADQLGGQRNVAHPQARIERLAEGADIERALILVQALHAGRRQALVVELAVVIVFDDPLAVLCRPAGQLQPAR